MELFLASTRFSPSKSLRTKVNSYFPKTKMKNFIALALLSFSVIASADTLNLSVVGIRDFSENKTRVGLAFPISSTKGKISFSGLVLTDSVSFSKPYLGAGMNYSLFRSGNLSLDATVGVSASISNLKNMNDVSWGYGARLSYGFKF